MARPITINIPHSLGKDEARNRIASGFGRLQDQMTGGLAGMVAMQNRWEGNRLHFAGPVLTQRITGRIDIEDKCIARVMLGVRVEPLQCIALPRCFLVFAPAQSTIARPDLD
jgi:hypothetical protein